MLNTTVCQSSQGHCPCLSRFCEFKMSVDACHHSLSSFKMSASTLIATLSAPILITTLCQRSKCMSALWQRSKGQCRCLSRHSVSVQSDGVDAQLSTTLCNCSKQHQSRPRTDSSAGAGEIVVFLCTRDNPRTFSLGRYRQAPSGRKPVTPEKQTPRWTL